MTVDLVTSAGVALAVALLVLSVIRAFLGTNGRASVRLRRGIDLLLVPLLLAFLLLAAARFIDLGQPNTAPTPGPNPSRLNPSP